MTVLYWEKSQDETQYKLFAGLNRSELATLTKATKHWGAVIWLPDCRVEREYNTLEKQIESVERVVRRWFELANTDLPIGFARVCKKCSRPTLNEEAYVDGHILCHPCADSFPIAGQPPLR